MWKSNALTVEAKNTKCMIPAEEAERTFKNSALVLTATSSFPSSMLLIASLKRAEKLSFFCVIYLLTN